MYYIPPVRICGSIIVFALTTVIGTTGHGQHHWKIRPGSLILSYNTAVVRDTNLVSRSENTALIKQTVKTEDVFVKDTVEHRSERVGGKYVLTHGYHLSFWGAEEDPDNFDVRMFRFINGNRSKFKDEFFPIVHETFGPTVLGMVPLMYGYGKLSKTQYDQNTAYLLAGAEITNFAITSTIKMVTARLRPYLALRNVYYRLIRGESTFSFPSGHASYTFCIATMFALRYSKYPYVYLPLGAWAFVVSYARSYFGLHYPVDIMAGAMVGIFSSSLVYAFRAQLLKALPGNTSEMEVDYKSALAVVSAYLATSALGNFVWPLFKKKSEINCGLNISPYMIFPRTGFALKVDW